MSHGRIARKAVLFAAAWLLAAGVGNAVSAQGTVPKAKWQPLFDGKIAR